MAARPTGVRGTSEPDTGEDEGAPWWVGEVAFLALGGGEAASRAGSQAVRGRVAQSGARAPAVWTGQGVPFRAPFLGVQKGSDERMHHLRSSVNIR